MRTSTWFNYGDEDGKTMASFISPLTKEFIAGKLLNYEIIKIIKMRVVSIRWEEGVFFLVGFYLVASPKTGVATQSIGMTVQCLLRYSANEFIIIKLQVIVWLGHYSQPFMGRQAPVTIAYHAGRHMSRGRWCQVK